MKVLVLDLETTVQKIGDKNDNSPKNPNNKLVSAHYGWLGFDTVDQVHHLVFHHNEQDKPDNPEPLKRAILDADLVVLHNAKFDFSWLMETGFPIPKKVWDTMIGEYIFARGQRIELSLKATAERRNVTRKKSDLVDELFKSGTGFEAMPLDTVLEYAEADVISTAEVYLSQLDELQTNRSKGLQPVFDLMHDMLFFLLEIEMNGVKIDMEALREVEVKYLAEQAEITKRLTEIVEEVMGDTPINLNSGADLSKVIYSRQLVDRELHRQTFNIGVNARGKPLPPPRMNDRQFANAVRTTTQKVYRTVAHCCVECNGSGKIRKIKKDGTPFKQLNKCPVCHGAGALYVPTGKIAGLKLVPEKPSDASINGFKAGKDVLPRLVAQAEKKDNLLAVEFLRKMSRLNAISTYLDSFIEGIKTWTRPSGFLHTNFNQTVTATGRLSSTNPNFQNLPKGHKFEVRKALVSRFDGGQIIEADFSGLEFRVAGELSRDPQIIDDILGGKDVHSQTASIIHGIDPSQVTKDQRQAAKATTFAPLYGGMGANEPPHVRQYFHEYFNIYQGLKRYHSSLADQALRDGYISTPSGRQFAFPEMRRLRSGRVTNQTMLVNYPVQSFATADQVPLACIRALAMFRERGLQSKLILTVHDSIVVDCHPDELDAVCDVLKVAMTGVPEEMQKRFNYTAVLPLNIEISSGPNWMEQTEIMAA